MEQKDEQINPFRTHEQPNVPVVPVDAVLNLYEKEVLNYLDHILKELQKINEKKESPRIPLI